MAVDIQPQQQQQEAQRQAHLQAQLAFQVDDYQPFQRPKAAGASGGQRWTAKWRLVLLGLGLLCVLQAVLNVALRLAARDAAAAAAAASAAGAVAEDEDEEEGAEACAPGWKPFACSCYFVSSERRNWDQSRKDCAHRDAHLVIIESRREQAFLSKLVEAAWVGMNDRQTEGRWLWLDGTQVSRDRLRWAPGQPDGAFGGEDCGDLKNMPDFKGLNDLNCSAKIRWICERPRCSQTKGGGGGGRGRGGGPAGSGQGEAGGPECCKECGTPSMRPALS